DAVADSGLARAHYVGRDGSERRDVAATVTTTGELAVVELDVDPDAAPPFGSLIALEGLRPATLWLRADAPAATARAGAALTGPAWWVSTRPPRRAPHWNAADSAELLTFELRAQPQSGDPALLAGLGFAPGAPNWVGDLPDDAARFADAAAGPSGAGGFPLAGTGLAGWTLFPVGMTALPE